MLVQAWVGCAVGRTVGLAVGLGVGTLVGTGFVGAPVGGGVGALDGGGVFGGFVGGDVRLSVIVMTAVLTVPGDAMLIELTMTVTVFPVPPKL